MSSVIQKRPMSLDWDFVKRSAWLGAKISFVVLAPIGVFCWLMFGGLLLYKFCESGLTPMAFLQAIDQANLSKVADGLVAVLLGVAFGVVGSAGMGAAVAASAVACHKLRDRIARRSLRN